MATAAGGTCIHTRTHTGTGGSRTSTCYGLWRRAFSNGIVLVNANGGAQAAAVLDQAHCYHDVNGNPVTGAHISLSPLTAAILTFTPC